MSRTSFALLTLLLSGAGFGVYGWQAVLALEQHRRISTARPVQARVLSVRVQEHVTRTSKGGTNRSYTPVVVYEYDVNGRPQQSNVVTPMPHSGSSEWANKVASRFVEGEPCEAYIDPERPQEAFLVKEYRFFYYGIMLLGLALACVPFLIWAGTPRAWPVSGVSAADGWRESAVARTMVQRIAVSLLASVLVNGGWVVAVGHYVWVAGGSEPTAVYLCASAGIVAGLIPLWTLIRTVLLSRAIGEARVQLQPGPVRVGQRFQARVEQELRVDANVEEVVIELVCDQTTKTTSGGKTRISTNEVHRGRVQAMPARLLGPGESISATAELQVPAHLGATNLTWSAPYPRYAWRIEVDTKLSGAPDYRGRFPIAVEPA